MDWTRHYRTRQVLESWDCEGLEDGGRAAGEGARTRWGNPVAAIIEAAESAEEPLYIVLL